MSAKDDIKAFSDKDGHFRRQPSKFRDSISRESGAKFPSEKDRYVCLHWETRV
jgi:putative glutathione S-transferase